MSGDSNSLILDNFIEFIVNKELIERANVALIIDKYVGAYIVNTIKQLYEEYENHKIWLDNKSAEEFELENFVEVINAYINGFASLNSEDIIKWLIDLKKKIDEIDNMNKQISQTQVIDAKNFCKSKTEIDSKSPEKNMIKLDQIDPNIKLLSEMFPDVKTKRINDVYKQANKCYERAIELLLNENDGSSVKCKGDEGDLVDLSEEEKKLLKERTVQKFGFVAVNEDGSIKEAPPPPTSQWNSEKKLVRYFDSKVVSTKGEKYFEVKTEEDEELAKQMKKTYVNLKPAKAYRFH